MESLLININEIFYSIQGESTYAGIPSVFIRTCGCNLNCNYCDTDYAKHEGSQKTIEAIVAEIKLYKTNYVCITGGEPLLQENVFKLANYLAQIQYKVSIETNGSIFAANLSPYIKIVFDVKTPDSGAAGSFNLKNLEIFNVNTEFKFVICSAADFLWAEEFASLHNLFTRATVLYSPSFSKISEKWLAKEMLLHQSSARLQLQQQKYIWSSNMRSC